MTGERDTPIRVDPSTGLKVFATRAAPATPVSGGGGYAVVEDERLTSLPPQPPGAVFAAEEQARYREFKEARRGAADYMVMDGEFSRYLEDLYSAAPIEREPLTDECEILVVGAGFAGLLLWYKLREAGFSDVRFCEKGGDVGGTWYWNRYPGIACDVEAYSYLPLLEEMGYIPTMKFASGYEILEYCQAMAERFGFYDHCLFHTTVEKTEWDEATGRWTVVTDRGDAMRARIVILANGILTSPKLARIDGHGDVRGRLLPHLPLGLRRRPRRQAHRDHRHRRHRRAGDPRTGQGGRPPRRVPAHAVDDRRARPAPDLRRRGRRVVAGARLGPGPAGPLRQDLRRPHGDEGQRRLPRRPGRRLQGAQAARARADAGGDDRQAARLELPDHGADPGARRRHRRGPGDRGRPQAVLPVRLQAADVPRRVPADVQPAERAPRRHRADGRHRDQRARRRPRRRRVPARRADLRDRLPMDGDVDVQHDHRPRRAHAQREVALTRAPARSSGCTATASRTCSS